MARWRRAALALFLGASFGVPAGAPEAMAEGRITLVAENDWFPYSADRNGRSEGMAVDLVRAAYRAVGIEVDLVSQPYARCLEEVEMGRQLGCFNTIREPANEARFQFHDRPLFSSSIVIVAPADSLAENLQPVDLKGQRVAVTNGYTYGEPFQSDPGIDKDVATSDLGVLRLVALKRAAYGVIYDRVMAHLLAENGAELAGKLRVVGLLAEPDLYVSFSKRRTDAAPAIAALDRGLDIIRANGVYREIEEEWALRFSVAGEP